MPAEYSTRYHQRFVDRLWMRRLGAVVLLYVIGVLVYFARLEVELYRTAPWRTRGRARPDLYERLAAQGEVPSVKGSPGSEIRRAGLLENRRRVAARWRNTGG